MKFNFKSTGYKVNNKKFKLSDQQKQTLETIPIGIIIIDRKTFI